MSKAVMAVRTSLVGVLGVAVVGSTLAISRRGDEYTFFNELIEVREVISRRYVEPVDAERLREGAIKGMVDALDDPYTVYVPASQKRNFNKDLTGEYVGIGAQVNQQEGWLTIVSPLEDSPAFRAGIMPDDRIVEIEGTSTHNVPVDDCINMLLGEPGTKVRFVVERKGERIPFEITRDRIKTRSVKGVRRSEADPNSWDLFIDPGRKVAYVRLVLDLRFNPGGLLDEAEKIADLFLEQGTIVSTRGRAIPEVVRKAEQPGTLPDFPIALLINGQSASASEVLAGALTENGRAIAVGTRSFGKGSVQSVVELSGGSELKVTEQGYFLPSGRSITRRDDSPAWGVDPSEGFYVPMTDQQVVEMLTARRQQELLVVGGNGAGAGIDWTSPESILSHFKDPQLAAAVTAMTGKLDAGEWTRTGEAQAAHAVAAGELTRLAQYRERLLRELTRTERRIDAVENATPQAAAGTPDLWADDLDLRGGTVEVRDKDGKVVATLEITGPDLERWLADAEVRRK